MKKISKRDKLYQKGRNEQFKILRNKIVTKIRKRKVDSIIRRLNQSAVETQNYRGTI